MGLSCTNRNKLSLFFLGYLGGSSFPVEGTFASHYFVDSSGLLVCVSKYR